MLIETALRRCEGNLTRAADVLGITFRSIRYKVKKLGIRS
jgi:DNA-binding NtrC family response regulator